jgi:Domain of unknown function (DUF4190)
MKKCPVCEKTFEDSMRFCQTDGSPLVDIVEEAPVDPYKTIVATPGDPLPPVTPDDPFKTVVAGSPEIPAPDASGDLLEMPAADPLKTMYVSEEEIRREMAGEPKPDEPIFEVPAEPLPPEPPAFSEPGLSPPVFGDMAPPPSPFAGADTPKESSSPWDEATSASGPDSTEGETLISPVGAIPSPFDTPAPQSYEPAMSPEPEPYSSPEPAVPRYEPAPPPTPQYAEPEPAVNPFEAAYAPAAEPAPQMEWAPPPAPEASWQNQPVGQNTPFQPPAASGGLNQTLPIVSLIFGIISICCYVGPLTGLVALITGFMGMKNANNDPAHYGGKGLAIAGMIVGGIFFLTSVVYWILIIVGVAIGNFGR